MWSIAGMLRSKLVSSATVRLMRGRISLLARWEPRLTFALSRRALLSAMTIEKNNRLAWLTAESNEKHGPKTEEKDDNNSTGNRAWLPL